ncbi:MAG: circularly permuted type 2 ATP-grasp protein [Cellvibrionaceae bacterium]|nr:circularly permuted type 2 ATP-grasp protein [Cellvibrionaceae bacterium]
MAQRNQKALRILRDDGATFNLFSDDANGSRTWELDLVPSLIGSEEWGAIETSLVERSELFNLLFKDLYGSRDLVRLGVIPPDVLFANEGFLRACQGSQGPGQHQLILHGVDMLRLADGQVCVLADRTQSPGGMGYALENRSVMSRVLPSLFRDSHVHRLAGFYHRVRAKLSSLATDQEDVPRVVVLTPGANEESYFEHAYLANYLGFSLVQSSDLVVRGGFVWMKSLEGLTRVDVILRGVDDWLCDPVELRSDSQHGVPGLLEVVRAGRVAIANPLGTGALESPVFLRYLPQISKALLGRELRMPSVQTYWCGDAGDLKYVLSHLNKLVIKPVERFSKQRSILAGELTSQQQHDLAESIKKQPRQFVAQPCLESRHLPTFSGGGLQPRPAILRSFALAGENSYIVMPGGLTRVGAEEGDFLVANHGGTRSKDTWVVASEPEKVMPPAAQNSVRASDLLLISLPSRVVENLFWMGRYAERAEASLRLLRTVFIMLNGEAPLPPLSRRYLLEAVTELTGTRPGFLDCDSSLLENPEPELMLVVKDAARVGSVRSNLVAMLRSADESKELLSSDTMRVINDISDTLQTLDDTLQEGGLSAAPEEALDPLVTALMALAGLAQESMLRGIGWQFMEIGRRIERGMQTVNILNKLLTQVLPESEQNILFETLLLSLEALISYRRRYRAHMGPMQILELVMLDASNPRSLVYQMTQLKNQITQLPKSKTSHFELSHEERAVLQGQTLIQLINLKTLCSEKYGSRPELREVLKKVKEVLAEISTVISDKYFDHRMGAQQLVRRDC